MDDDERFVITPKGIAALALTKMGLVESVDDWRIDGFWAVFETKMRACGYVERDDEDDRQRVNRVS